MSLEVSDDVQAIYYIVGRSILWNVIGTVCESGFWAIYLVLFLFSLRIQLLRGVREFASIVLLSASLTLFVSSTALWAMNLTTTLAIIKGFFLKYPMSGLQDRIDSLNQDVIDLWIPEETLFLLNMVIGDAVVIWRAWVLCRSSRLQRLVWFPMVMLSFSFAFAVIALNCLASESSGNQSSIPEGSRTCQWGEPIAWGISLLTNVTSTSIIAVRTWMHRQFLRRNLGSSHPNSQSEKIMVLLVESGFIYSLFWLSQIVLFFPVKFGTVGQRFWTILGSMGDQISGLYPTLIIILVNMKRSMADHEAKSIPSSGGQVQLSTLQFQSGQFVSQDNTMSPTSSTKPYWSRDSRRDQVSV